MADLKSLKLSDQDRKLIENAETMLGPEPASMGVVKNYFWGQLRGDLLFPYPEPTAEEDAECRTLLDRLDVYLRAEHPATQIDQEQDIPRWVIDRLFELGVLGMTIPREFGGLGMGITSYNRVLERIGHSCGSTAVLVSAHQSIGCKAIMLFGTDEQKRRWLPKLATEWLSAFCLSEPDVGCDASGQRTRCEKTPDGRHYILNGEKKWATSGAIASLFTVMARQKLDNGQEKVTALVCTPDMPGVDIFQKNRSKCGIRGTWQARMRLHDVRVPVENLLHSEGRGLNVALSCLNYGRCTLSAGMLGGARRAMDQAVKWSRTRHQFQRPLSDFELVKQRVARMAAYCYAMDSVLYMTTGMLDRADDDIMLETAICKVFCSEMGWRTVNDAMQIMGGEGYMTENEVERIFRDSRINLVVEGANEVMQSFIFAYGGKQLAEAMLGVKQAVSKGKLFNRTVLRAALPLALELFLGIRRRAPQPPDVHPELRRDARRLSALIQEHAHQFKVASKRFEEAIVTRQAVQARLADNALWIHAYACTLSKLDRELRAGPGARSEAEAARDKAAALHFLDMVEVEVRSNFRTLFENADDSMLRAAQAVLDHSDTLPNDLFVIHESSPVARGTGRLPDQSSIPQFPGDRHEPRHETGRAQAQHA